MQNINNETNLPTTSKQPKTDSKTFFPCTNLQTSSCQISQSYYPLANEVVKGYSNATIRPSVLPSFRNILVNTLESTSFNGF